ncbi:MAG: PIN domain-containing protein [Breznakiellaceae bacterium]
MTNLYYVLRKAGGDRKARKFISEIIKYLTVISVEQADVVDALASSFNDFEDALQYFAAVRNQCDGIVTRNTSDYVEAKLPVYSPMEFIALYKDLW